MYNFVKWVLRGLVNWGAYNRTKKTFQNKLHNSANQNTFSIHSLFKASKRCKNRGGRGIISEAGGGVKTECPFCLQVDGPIAWGLIIGGGGGAYTRTFTVMKE